MSRFFEKNKNRKNAIAEAKKVVNLWIEQGKPEVKKETKQAEQTKFDPAVFKHSAVVALAKVRLRCKLHVHVCKRFLKACFSGLTVSYVPTCSSVQRESGYFMLPSHRVIVARSPQISNHVELFLVLVLLYLVPN